MKSLLFAVITLMAFNLKAAELKKSFDGKVVFNPCKMEELNTRAYALKILSETNSSEGKNIQFELIFLKCAKVNDEARLIKISPTSVLKRETIGVRGEKLQIESVLSSFQLIAMSETGKLIQEMNLIQAENKFLTSLFISKDFTEKQIEIGANGVEQISVNGKVSEEYAPFIGGSYILTVN